MNIQALQPFIIKSANSPNIKVKKVAESLLDQVISAKQTEEIEQPTLHSQERNQPLNDRPKDNIDAKIDTWMTDIAQPEPDASYFGKSSAAYCSDVTIDSLPSETQDDINKFVPEANKKSKVVQYGMVVDELLPKADTHNLKAAEEHVNKDLKDKGKKSIADKFQGKVDNKYILLLNDKIIDGHHFLSLAKVLGISCSLKVLDLTPLRFQYKKASSLFHKLAYVLQDNSR